MLVNTVFRLAAKIVTVVSEGKPSVVRTSFSMNARFVADGNARFTRAVTGEKLTKRVSAMVVQERRSKKPLQSTT